MTNGVYKFLGFLALGVALIGFVMPVLPGTPFLLLSAWCFARSSEKWHRWLLQSQFFGPIIRNWEANKCISLRTKVVALTTMLLVGGSSAYFTISNPWLLGLVYALMGVGAVSILSIRTCPKTSSDGR